MIRLTAKDFDALKASYFTILDMRAELATIDAKFCADPPKGKWFTTMAGWLNAKHQRLLTEKKAATEPKRDPNRPYAGPETRAHVIKL